MRSQEDLDMPQTLQFSQRNYTFRLGATLRRYYSNQGEDTAPASFSINGSGWEHCMTEDPDEALWAVYLLAHVQISGRHRVGPERQAQHRHEGQIHRGSCYLDKN